MTFKEWLCSSYPNPSKHGEWGLGHIISLIIIAAFIVVSTLLLKKRSEKDKRLVLLILAGTIMFFELARRVINLCITPNLNLHLVLRILLPRPGCAISCWLVMIAVFLNKKTLYNRKRASKKALFVTVFWYIFVKTISRQATAQSWKGAFYHAKQPHHREQPQSAENRQSPPACRAGFQCTPSNRAFLQSRP